MRADWPLLALVPVYGSRRDEDHRLLVRRRSDQALWPRRRRGTLERLCGEIAAEEPAE